MLPPHDKTRFSRTYDDIPCVWMTAGVLAYQLCNREFDCSECSLDIALRKHFSNESSRHVGTPDKSLEDKPCKLRNDRFYSNRHCWIQQQTKGTFRIGIEPYLARVLLIPKSVVLPSLGQHVRAHQTSVWIILEQGTFPISSPMDGVVIRRNPLIAEQPSNMLQHPFDDGWLYELECEQAPAKELLNDQQASELYKQDKERLNNLLASSLHSQTPELGPTLADGGIYLQHIADMLGYEKYLKLVKMVYS